MSSELTAEQKLLALRYGELAFAKVSADSPDADKEAEMEQIRAELGLSHQDLMAIVEDLVKRAYKA